MQPIMKLGQQDPPAGNGQICLALPKGGLGGTDEARQSERGVGRMRQEAQIARVGGRVTGWGLGLT